MSQVTGKKVAVTPMPTPTGTSGAIIDSFNTQDDQTVNAPSIHIVKDALTTINDNLAQTPITKGGVTLSTIDDKLNYLVEGAPNVVKEITNFIYEYDGNNYVAIKSTNLTDYSCWGTFQKQADASYTSEYLTITYTHNGTKLTISANKPCFVTLNKSVSNSTSEQLESQMNYNTNDYILNNLNVHSGYYRGYTLLVEEPRT